MSISSVQNDGQATQKPVTSNAVALRRKSMAHQCKVLCLGTDGLNGHELPEELVCGGHGHVKGQPL